jgi:hypothetical protein
MFQPICDGVTVSAASADCVVPSRTRVADVTGISHTLANITPGYVDSPPSSAPGPHSRLFFCVAATSDVLPTSQMLLATSSPPQALPGLSSHGCTPGSSSASREARLAWPASLFAGSCPPYPCAAMDGGYTCTCSAPDTARSRSGFATGNPCAQTQNAQAAFSHQVESRFWWQSSEPFKLESRVPAGQVVFPTALASHITPLPG